MHHLKRSRFFQIITVPLIYQSPRSSYVHYNCGLFSFLLIHVVPHPIPFIGMSLLFSTKKQSLSPRPNSLPLLIHSCKTVDRIRREHSTPKKQSTANQRHLLPAIFQPTNTVITFSDQSTSVTPSGIQLLSWAHHLAEQTSYINGISQTSRQWLHHASSGCHLPIASGRGPTELWEITKVTMCIFTSEWPQVGTEGCWSKPKAAMTLYRHLRLTFV